MHNSQFKGLPLYESSLENYNFVTALINFTMKRELFLKSNKLRLQKIWLICFFIIFQIGFSQQGAALHFDGADDYVTCGNILPTSYTKEAWIYIESLSTQNNIISGGLYDGQHAFWAPSTNSGKLSAGHNGYWYEVQDSVPLSINTWYHVAVTYDAATTTMKLYKNGELISTNTNVPPVSGGNMVRLGSFDNAANVFKGTMDEVRIWNRVLTDCEIKYNKDKELAANQTGLVANYKFNQGNANGDNNGLIDLIDSSENGYDAELNNFLLNGTTSNWVSPGSTASGVTGTLFVPLSANASQSFCSAAQVSNLSASGSGTFNWYDVANGGTPLASTQALSTGTYYVSQTTGTCESARIPVDVVVNIVPPPTANANQNFNANKKVADLLASGSNLKWYLASTGGTPLNSTDFLTNNSYYVSQTINGCESTRTMVQVTVNGGSLNFNDTTDSVNLGTAINSAIDPINTFTVEAWVYPTALNNGFGHSIGSIIGNYNTQVVDMQFLLRKEGANYNFWVNDSNSNNYKSVIATNVVTLNQWQHIAGVWNGSDIKIYINGNLIATTTGVTGASFKSQLNNPIIIGKNLSNEKFVGNIDEIKLWKRALSAAEIENNMNCELANSQTGLIAYYKFNQGIANTNNASVNTLIDSSGNNYSGTLNGFSLNGNTSNWAGISAVNTGFACPTYLSVSNSEKTQLKYFPNPTSNKLFLTSKNTILEVEVMNLLGQTVIKQKGSNAEIELNLTSLSPAPYLIKVKTQDGFETIKILKK